MKEISLNEQQIQFIEDLLYPIVEEDKAYSRTYAKIAQQIITKLEEE